MPLSSLELPTASTTCRTSATSLATASVDFLSVVFLSPSVDPGSAYEGASKTYAAARSSTMGLDAWVEPSSLRTTALVGAGGGAGAGDTSVSTPATHEYLGAALDFTSGKQSSALSPAWTVPHNSVSLGTGVDPSVVSLISAPSSQYSTGEVVALCSQYEWCCRLVLICNWSAALEGTSVELPSACVSPLCEALTPLRSASAAAAVATAPASVAVNSS